MWGSDYPHDEGTGPYTREALRQVMHDLPEDEMRRILGENAAKLYGFDLDALGAARRGVRARRSRRSASRSTSCPENPNSALLGRRRPRRRLTLHVARPPIAAGERARRGLHDLQEVGAGPHPSQLARRERIVARRHRAARRA